MLIALLGKVIFADVSPLSAVNEALLPPWLELVIFVIPVLVCTIFVPEILNALPAEPELAQVTVEVS